MIVMFSKFHQHIQCKYMYIQTYDIIYQIGLMSLAIGASDWPSPGTFCCAMFVCMYTTKNNEIN